MNPDLYERALKNAHSIVAGVTPDQLDDPTPCSDWDVRDLLNHLIGGCIAFAAGAEGERADFTGDTDHVGDGDHVSAFEDASARALEAFRSPGSMEKTFTMQWGDTPGLAVLGLAVGDATVHAWDLAQATGKKIEIDDDIAEAVYGMTTQMMAPKGNFPRGDSFKDPIEVGEDASPSDRMLAYLGREP